MAVYTGVRGALKVGDVVVADLEGFSLEVSREIHDYIVLRTDFKRKQYGVGDWKGSADARWNMLDTTGQKAMQQALMGGTTLEADFEIDNPAVGTYSGTILVAGIKIENSGDGLASVSFDFEGDGPPAFA